MIVTAVDIVDSVNDAGSLTTMLEQAEEETGVRTPLTLADAGYHAGRTWKRASSATSGW